MKERPEQNLVLICPGKPAPDSRLFRLLEELDIHLEGFCLRIYDAEDLQPIRNSRILFAVAVDAAGVNLEWGRMLQKIRLKRKFFEGSVGAVIMDSPSEFFTKAVGREAVLSANMSGCAFPGRPLVEATGSLMNFKVLSDLGGTSLWETYVKETKGLIDRLCDFRFPEKKKAPKILVLHASIRETSNTLSLWNLVRSRLPAHFQIQEIPLLNGKINDCIGCPFTTCMHFSQKGKCYYGGVVVEQVHPALEECDALVMLCPNYNDALSANLQATVNRLTSIYRRRQFFDKLLFGIIVSGYSGSDILASQLISALNMNKTFTLPPHFVMMETANDPGSILKSPGIEERADLFAQNLIRQLSL